MDASGKISYGGLCESSYMMGVWDPKFIDDNNLSIEYLELYALVAAVVAWID